MKFRYQAKKATRSKARLKIGITGPSGSGKTYSSLLLAHGLVGDWNKIAVLETENGSSHFYAHLGGFDVIPLETPFCPENYIGGIEYIMENIKPELIIIDSATHEWSGEGGALDMVNDYGGRFTDWAKVTPQHRKFINAILQTDAHFICTTRAKTDWVVEKNEKGKSEPRKVGLKSEQREGIEYEYTIAFRLMENHLALCDKDRTGLFAGKNPFLINEKTGKEILDWYNSGADVEKFDPNNAAHCERVGSYLHKRNIEMEHWNDVFAKLDGVPFEQKAIVNAINKSIEAMP